MQRHEVVMKSYVTDWRNNSRAVLAYALSADGLFTLVPLASGYDFAAGVSNLRGFPDFDSCGALSDYYAAAAAAAAVSLAVHCQSQLGLGNLGASRVVTLCVRGDHDLPIPNYGIIPTLR